MSSHARPAHPGWADRRHRAFLFAPGNHPVYVHKVTRYVADVVVLDLEDAVADAEKEQARQTVAQALAGDADRRGVAVRINGTASGLLDDDVAAVVGPGLDGIVCPKIESVDDLAHVDSLIAHHERATGLPVGSIWLVGIVESARGLVEVERLCAHAPERVVAVCLGWADLALDAGIELTSAATELLYARSRVVFASRAAGLGAPIDGPWLWLDDLDGLASDARLSRRLGFQGRIVVHPRQVEAVHSAYGELSPEDAARHSTIVESFEAALAKGSASVRVAGVFVDYPVYERSREQLRRYAVSER